MTTKRLKPENFRSGFCYWMAIALHRDFGHQIGALVVDLPKGGRHVVHAYCLDEDGNPYDAVGKYAISEMNEDYLEDKRRWKAFEHITFETELQFMATLLETAQSVGAHDVFADMGWTEEMIQLASDHIPEFFPERISAPAIRF